MDCGERISYSALLRKVIRINDAGTCGALALTSVAFAEPLACHPPHTLELMALTTTDDSMRVVVANETPSRALCVLGPTDVFFRATVANDGSDHAVKVVMDDPVTDECSLSDGLYTMPTEEMIRRTCMEVDQEKMIGAQLGADISWNIIDCDTKDYSDDQLVRMCMIEVGDGSFRWRVIEVDEEVEVGAFNSGFTNGFDI